MREREKKINFWILTPARFHIQNTEKFFFAVPSHEAFMISRLGALSAECDDNFRILHPR